MRDGYRSTFLQKVLLIGIHAGFAYLGEWILFDGGLERISAFANSARLPGDPWRRLLILSFIVAYALRSSLTLLVLHPGRIRWSETLKLTVLLTVSYVIFIFVGGVDQSHLALQDYVAIGLYFTGSWLSSEALLERHAFMRDQNGLFTGGLFRFAMHIDCFGEWLVFLGFALLTGNIWTLSIPATLLILLISVEIPARNRRLAVRYPAEFDAWAAHTRSLIPFVY